MRFLVGMIVGVAVALLGLGAYKAVADWRGDTLAGHWRYAVAPVRSLIPLDHARQILLRPRAAAAFRRMQVKAAADGVSLVAVSGFRSLEKQKDLFFRGAALKGESMVSRAHVCAPPGFSEHHTGYSLDIGDGAHRDVDLEARFRDTEGFHWLRRHAAKFHFEMSFPRGNSLGVAHEPWHWRYVGDLASFKTFFRARLDTE